MPKPPENGVVRLPVRTRRALTPDGSAERDAIVFCPLLARSMPIDLCAHCTRAEAQTEDAFLCRIQLPRDDGRPRVDVSEAAARTYVGEVLARETVCVREDASMEVVMGLLADGAACVPVVSESGRLMGVARRGATSYRSPEEARAIRAGVGAGPVGVTLPESLPLSMAIAVIARTEEQPLPVLSEAGAVVGALSAVDIVRWVARRMGYDVG